MALQHISGQVLATFEQKGFAQTILHHNWSLSVQKLLVTAFTVLNLPESLNMVITTLNVAF